MTQNNRLFFNLDVPISQDDITDKELLQLPEPFFEEPKNSHSKTFLTYEPKNLFITTTNKPTPWTIEPKTEI